METLSTNASAAECGEVASTFDPSSGLTCITCRLVFANATIQREHYQEEWHRYNVKRRVVGFPPVTKPAFDEVAKQYQAPETVGDTTRHCQACRKTFQSSNAFENHLQSKRHQQNALAFTQKSVAAAEQNAFSDAPKLVETSAENSSLCVNVSEGRDQDSLFSEMEAVNDKYGGDKSSCDYDESEAIPFLSCIFCATTTATHKQAAFISLDALMSHMLYEHGFQLPDREFCTDIPGLLTYLGQKIGCGKTCLWCGQSNFCDRMACQKHMRDKNHCCFSLDGTGLKKSKTAPDDYDGEHLIEYIDFYDYSALYDDDANVDGKGGEEENAILYDDGAFLVLPSGARIGHRSLQRYFRQSLKPLPEDGHYGGAGKSSALLHGKILAVSNQLECGKMGFGGLTRSVDGNRRHLYVSSRTELQRRAHDITFVKRKLQQFRLKQGMQNNRLFKSRGRDDQQ